ncbi:hypothetical protein A4X09_0g5304 [Tilletia walkeri]|uniref:Uncharacterized protein n=1 Tax=Tilletia walkeri TaxID=117179 RepID=A0A8X7N7N7_9BASI|nr:hypothetical protein A4X09_0g5304 [Tilletia walkeri]
MEANEEEYWRKNSGMDVRRPLPGERNGAQILRMAIDAYEQGQRRGSTLATAYSRSMVPAASAAAVSSSSNNRLPPTLVLTNLSEKSQREAKHFLDAVRATSPEGAVADKLLLAGGAGPSAVGASFKAGLTGAQRYIPSTNTTFVPTIPSPTVTKTTTTPQPLRKKERVGILADEPVSRGMEDEGGVVAPFGPYWADGKQQTHNLTQSSASLSFFSDLPTSWAYTHL